MINDLIADMLTRIRNACLVKHQSTNILYSKLNLAILKVFLNEGYISTYQIYEINTKPLFINITLNYKGWWMKESFFSILRRISKPGKRIYSSYKNFNKYINTLKYNQGFAIISTSNGIMTHYKAINMKKGGEILCYIE